MQHFLWRLMDLSIEKIRSNPGTVVDWTTAEGTAKVKLRWASTQTLNEIKDRHAQPVSFRGEINREVNEVEAERDRIEYCVVDWSGINGEDGQPLACNRDNKVFLYEYYPPFQLFVKSKLAALNVGAIALREQEEKNLKPSQDGTA